MWVIGKNFAVETSMCQYYATNLQDIINNKCSIQFVANGESFYFKPKSAEDAKMVFDRFVNAIRKKMDYCDISDINWKDD